MGTLWTRAGSGSADMLQPLQLPSGARYFPGGGFVSW